MLKTWVEQTAERIARSIAMAEERKVIGGRIWTEI
ncbi:MAG: hypothetical protein PCFJNLEI_03523 [Verrucomicrobiae bacterium]|nr:hypothetical protein [Verrucomicrobiae bacterium]